MHQPGCCLIDKYFGSGMHLERAKAEITPKQRAAGPSPHPTFPEHHLLPEQSWEQPLASHPAPGNAEIPAKKVAVWDQIRSFPERNAQA